MRGVFFVVLLFFLYGCTKLGPDFTPITPPKAPKDLQKQNKQVYKDVVNWWEIFHDKKLNKLINKAVKENLDIKSAGVRILQSRALLGIANGLWFPQQQNISGAYTTSYKKSFSNFSNLSFDIGWEIDLWGKYARGIESAEADLYTTIAQYRDIVVLIVSEVARNYIIYQTTKERIEYTKRNIAIQDYVTRLTEIQFKSGNVSELDMQQAKTELYNTKALLPSLELTEIKSINALAVLLGTSSDEVKKILDYSKKDISKNSFLNSYLNVIKKGDVNKDTFSVNYIPLPDFNVSKKIDASLILQRPDIKVAEYKARSASAKIGKNKANLYPSFLLFGSIDIYSPSVFGNNLIVNAGPGFSWNVFQYSRLKNQVRFADARFEEAVINYSKKVLKAYEDVSNAMNAYKSAKEQLKQREEALKATLRAFNISLRQYKNGLVSYQRVLSTIEKLTYTQDVYAQTKGIMANDVVFLYKALGGGWQISNGEYYLSKDSLNSFKDRGIDWGDFLDKSNIIMPKGWK